MSFFGTEKATDLNGMLRSRVARWTTTTVAVAGLSVSAALGVEVNENLSISGFIDKSIVIGLDSNADEPDDLVVTGGVDQLEIDLDLTFGNVTGRVDINSLPDGVSMEQAFLTYSPESMTDMGVGITFGRFLSSLGFEAAEPTGLYQYSVSAGIPYPGYQNGVAVSLAPTDMIGVYVAAISSAWDSTDYDWETPAFEGQVSVKPTDMVTVKAGAAAEDMGDYFQIELNAWAMLTSGALTVAGEADMLSNWGADGENGIHFLGMANYKLTDKVGVTARFSGYKLDSMDEADTEVTLSPSYAIADNWGALVELRQNLQAETTQVAIESIFTF
ncbi:MAG: outer membrane beta-barrel protein [Candidatus Poribacteria bacterium]|nr:outer membrane beta-barrel protein [Candidatus Poribacteria bacterium]